MLQSQNYFAKKNRLIGIAVILLLMLCAAYSNHFANGFQYDDTHAIVDNAFVRNIKDLPLFFTNIKYFGTNINNQGYRPVIVSLNAIDYWLGGGLYPFYFHLDIFVSYVALLVLLFFFFKNIFISAESNRILEVPGKEHHTSRSARSAPYLVALLAVGFYGMHAANAETINYIIQRADSFSTLLIVASLLLYINPSTRKYYLYIFTTALAIVTKEVAVVTAGLLFFYILFFEENASLTQLFKLKKSAVHGALRALIKSFPALVFTTFFFGKISYWFISGHTVAVDEALPSALSYYATEAVVIAHYLGNFILPVDLSISSGFTIIASVSDTRVLFSFVIICLLIVIAFITSNEKEKRPISFGIIWFFITLIPSSLLVKTGELANDHRTFLPFIGLVMSLAWWLRLIYFRYVKRATRVKSESITEVAVSSGSKRGTTSAKTTTTAAAATATPTANFLSTPYLLGIYFIIISLQAFGTHERNIVWSSYENLWHDAVIKNPDDYMADMNYGLALMNKGKYDETLPYFEKVLSLDPHWAYINVNMGVLKDNMGKPNEADPYFRKAIQFQPFYPVGYYYYGRFLVKYGKSDQAIKVLNDGLKVSPGDMQIIDLLNRITTLKPEDKLAQLNKMAAVADQNPTTNNYLNLSVEYYRNAMYKECVETCEKVLKLDPNRAMAYNNICASLNALGQFAKAEEACKKALRLDPNLQLAKDNLNILEKNLNQGK